MFAIMGATGQVGGAVLETLSRHEAMVRIIARDPARAARLAGQRVEIVRGDAADPASLTAAFAGARAVFVMLVPPTQAVDVLADSRAMGQAIADAIRAAQVPHVVALSSAGAHLAEGNGIVRALHDFETALAGVAPSLVLLRASDFMENWAAMLPAARGAGILPSAKLPLEAKGEVVSVRDVGHSAAELLVEPRPGSRIVSLCGPRQYSPADAAAILSRLLAKPVAAVPSSRAETIAGLLASGAGLDYAERLADLSDAVNAGRMEFPAGMGEVRRGTVELEEVLSRLIGGTSA